MSAESCRSGGDGLRAGHPDRLDDLEDCRTDHDKHEESNELGADGVLGLVLRTALHLASLSNVLGVLLVGFSHLGSARHLGAVVSAAVCVVGC